MHSHQHLFFSSLQHLQLQCTVVDAATSKIPFAFSCSYSLTYLLACSFPPICSAFSRASQNIPHEVVSKLPFDISSFLLFYLSSLIDGFECQRDRMGRCCALIERTGKISFDTKTYFCWWRSILLFSPLFSLIFSLFSHLVLSPSSCSFFSSFSFYVLSVFFPPYLFFFPSHSLSLFFTNFSHLLHDLQDKQMQ
ncbi:MAG: hypothetical protein JOS17DRAFT_336949 [Linnemannia elongata]|nr:MAG: hypothetical protein JOS17DRAFT_336949 [Linnemannia elongata]